MRAAPHANQRGSRAMKAKKNRPQAIPDASQLNTDYEYISALVDVCRERHGYKSYQGVADAIGVSRSSIKSWRGKGVPKPIPYAYQFALERLAYS